MKKNYASVVMLLFFSFPLSCDVLSYADSISFDYLYPQTLLYRFHVISKELWSFLDRLGCKEACNEGPSLRPAKVVLMQSAKLRELAPVLCAQLTKTDCPGRYNAEDIACLVALVDLVQAKIANRVDLMRNEAHALATALAFFEETKQLLACVLNVNSS